jgi:hypothetical protein
MSNPLSVSSIGVFAAGSAASAGPPRTVRAARAFEASLVAELLSSLEKTFAGVPGDSGLAGADDYNYLGTHALAEGIAARGGFGIASLISRELERHEGKGGLGDERVGSSLPAGAKV